MKKLKVFLIVLMAMLTSCCLVMAGCEVNRTYVPDPITVESLELDGTEGIVLIEGDALTLADLQSLRVTATFSGEKEPMTISLEGLEELPAGLTVDKLGEPLAPGEQTIIVTYEYEGSSKSASFEVTVLEKLPEGTLVFDEVPAGAAYAEATAKGETAKAAFKFAYAEQGLVVTAYVQDAAIFGASASVFVNDGIEIDLDKVLRQKGYGENTVGIVVDANADVAVKRLADEETVENHGVEANVTPISFDDRTIGGYRLVVTIPYALVGIDAEKADAAVCVGLNNAYNANIAQFIYADACGEDYANVHTYAHVKADGSLEENFYLDYAYMWGDGGNNKASAVWDLEGDDGEQNFIAMTGNDYVDNYIYMKDSDKLNFYAEVSLRVAEVMRMGNGAYDAYPKFGMVVKTTSAANGFAYYIDAVSNAETGQINSGSTALGYNTLTNGAWDGLWSSIGSIGGNSAAYTDGYVTLGIYRQGGVFSFYCNGNLVSTTSTSLGAEEAAYVGLFTFNLRLEAKDYKFITDEEALAPYMIERRDVDYLFLGSSYISTAFWYNWGNAFGAMNAANIGVPGSRISLWENQLPIVEAQYDPANIIIYIGGNDINDGHLTGAATFALLKAMLEHYHATFPNATIHYSTVVRSMLFPANWEEDLAYYNLVMEYAKDLDWLKIIDLYAAVTPDANGSTQHWFGADGLHFGVDGYALFTAKVFESLGLERPETLGETGLGDVNVEGAPQFDYAPGWVLENGIAHNVGKSYERIGSESEIFISGLYATDFYAEVKISLGDCYCPTDAWAKTGIALRGETGTYFYFINSSSVTNPQRTADGHIKYTDNWGNVFYREETMNRNWGPELFGYFYLGAQSFDHYTDDSYATLAVVKRGKTLIFIANGNVVATLNESLFGADQKIAASVFTFNMDVYAKDAYFTTDSEEIDYILATPHNVSVAEATGATITVNKQTAKKTDVIEISIELEEGYRLAGVYVNDAEIKPDEEGKYSFVMPDENVTVFAKFEGRKSVDMSAVEGKLSVSNSTPQENDVITFTANEGWSLEKLYVNGKELAATDGKYILTVAEDMVITAEIYELIDGIKLDGRLDEAYGETATHAYYEGNREIILYALRTDAGLFIRVTSYMNSTKTDSGNWFENTNIEFRLNAGAQRYLNINGAKNGVTSYYWQTDVLAEADGVHTAGQYRYNVELFVAADAIPGFGSEVQINYAWKTLGETAGVLNTRVTTGWAFSWGGDWLARHQGGLDIGAADVLTGLDTFGSYSKQLMATAKGLRIAVDAADAVIDGKLDDELYSGLNVITNSDDYKTISVTGKVGSDGVYLGVTATFDSYANLHYDNWSLNNNLEIRFNERTTVVIIADGYVYFPDLFARAAYTTAEQNGKIVVTMEMFAAGNFAENYRFLLGANGADEGFHGWLLVTNCFIGKTGLTTNAPAIPQGLTLDGKFDDALWTAEVTGRSYTTDARGAQVSVMGRLLSDGVLIGVTVNHSVPVTQQVKENGTAWWHYMGPEFRLAGLGTQIAVTTWNNTAIGPCVFGHYTVDNGEDAAYRYTTTYEVYVAYYGLNIINPSRCAFVIGGVYETDFSWLFNNGGISHYIYADGMRTA